jgi:hypothetical protein
MGLKPCPFCNEIPSVVLDNNLHVTKHTCKAFGDSWCNIIDWNTRPIEAEANKRIAELEAELVNQHRVIDSLRITEGQLMQKIEQLEAAQRWIEDAK